MNLKEFFSFRKMISTEVIKDTYIVGMVILILGGIIIMFNPPGSNEVIGNINPIWAGIVVIVAGNVLWRVLCECLILFFSIHEVLISIERELKDRDIKGI